MKNQDKDSSQKDTAHSDYTRKPAANAKQKAIKILLIVMFLVVLVGVVRVVRYTKQNLPPSTALLPVPAEVLERGAGKKAGP